MMLAHWRCAALQLHSKLLGGLSHIRVSHVHLSEEVVCQSSVVIESTQVGTADIAYLQLLVARRTGGILEVLKVTLTGLLLVFGGADLVHFGHGHCNGTCLAEDGDFEKAAVNGVGEVCDLFELYRILANTLQQKRGLVLDIPERWFAGSHLASSLAGVAQYRCGGHSRQCTFVYRACSRSRSPISPSLLKTPPHTPPSVLHCAPSGRVRGPASCL